MWHQNNQERQSGNIATTPVLLQQNTIPSLSENTGASQLNDYKYTTTVVLSLYPDTHTHPHKHTYCTQLSHQANWGQIQILKKQACVMYLSV